MLRFVLPAALALAAAAAPSTAAAAEPLDALPLESLLKLEVTSASRFTQRTAEAPAMVTVVTRDEIRDHGWRTLADLLDAVPGLFVTTDRAYSYVGVRGLMRPADYNTNVLLLIDGVPANDSLYNQAYLGGEFILDLQWVDHVEFVPGPGSAMYGSNAILGVINVVTRGARDLAGPRASLTAGGDRTRGAGASYGVANATREALVAASTSRDEGEAVRLPPAAGLPYGRARGVDDERGERAMLKYAWGEFSLFGAYSDRRKAYPTAAYFTRFGDRRAAFEDRLFLLALAHQGEAAPGLTLTSRLSAGGADFFGDYPYASPDVLNRDTGRSRWWGVDLQATDVRFDRHTLVYGLEYRRDDKLEQENFDVAPPASYLDDHREASHTGLYLEDEWHLGRWRLNLGLRGDHYDSFGSAVSPRLALIDALSPRTTIKYLFGTAYRAPNAFELYYHDGATMKANPRLRPERSRSLEWGVEHVAGGGWVLTGSLFENHVRDLIAQELDPADDLLVYRNGGKVAVRGTVLAARREWADGRRLAASWNWQQFDHDADFGRPTHMPRAVAKADATLPLGPWRATLEERYIGRRLTTAGDTGATAFTNLALWGAPAWLGGGAMTVRVDNLFDRRLVDPASDEYDHDVLPRRGRLATVTLSWPL